jgi:hypothetical protein
MSFNCRRVQIFEDLMGLLRVRWVALVGPSNGGPTEAAFAVRKPTTVSHLVPYHPVTPPAHQGPTSICTREVAPLGAPEISQRLCAVRMWPGDAGFGAFGAPARLVSVGDVGRPGWSGLRVPRR